MQSRSWGSYHNWNGPLIVGNRKKKNSDKTTKSQGMGDVFFTTLLALPLCSNLNGFSMLKKIQLKKKILFLEDVWLFSYRHYLSITQPLQPWAAAFWFAEITRVVPPSLSLEQQTEKLWVMKALEDRTSSNKIHFTTAGNKFKIICRDLRETLKQLSPH